MRFPRHRATKGVPSEATAEGGERATCGLAPLDRSRLPGARVECLDAACLDLLGTSEQL